MARWAPARADVIGEYAAEVLQVFPRGRLLVGLGGVEAGGRQAFAQDLAAAFEAAGVSAAAVELDADPDDAGIDRFRREVLAPFRAGTDPRAVLVVSGRFLQHPDLVGLWHANAWLQVPRAVAREREAARRGVDVDDPVLEREFAAVDRYFRAVDPRKRATASFDATDAAHPRRVFEDAC